MVFVGHVRSAGRILCRPGLKHNASQLTFSGFCSQEFDGTSFLELLALFLILKNLIRQYQSLLLKNLCESMTNMIVLQAYEKQ